MKLVRNVFWDQSSGSLTVEGFKRLKIRWHLGMSITWPCRAELQKLEPNLEDYRSHVLYGHDHLSLNTEPNTHRVLQDSISAFSDAISKRLRIKYFHCLIIYSTWWPSTAPGRCFAFFIRKVLEGALCPCRPGFKSWFCPLLFLWSWASFKSWKEWRMWIDKEQWKRMS